MTQQTREIVESKAKELFQLWLYPSRASGDLIWNNIAKHVLASEIRAEIKGLVFCHPDLNSEAGISIVKGSNKDFALSRKIELEKQLAELEAL